MFLLERMIPTVYSILLQRSYSMQIAQKTERRENRQEGMDFPRKGYNKRKEKNIPKMENNEKSEGELWELKNHLDEKVQVRPREMRESRRLRKNS